jgi:hypothetical protein
MAAGNFTGTMVFAGTRVKRMIMQDQALYWRKSSLSFANGNCAEVGQLGSASVGVRDTKESTHPHRVTLKIPVTSWCEFSDRVKAGWQPEKR